jgi:predicted lipoprotein with Yx(FWY)xxD motif
MSKRWLVPAGLAAAALIAAGCGSTSSSGSPAGSGGGGGNQGTSAAAGNQVKSAKIGGAEVLTDSKGFTLYWFAPDTSTASKCSGKCAVFWPPVKGPVTAGVGVTGDLGTITRAGGSLQATWDGHPLYTFKGDTAPGQNKGNGINANGGLWHEITLSGKAAPSAKHTKNGSGGGGYGY